MKKVQFGCGSNLIPGWENFDRDVDIRKRLPFEDASVDYVFSEHVIEHISSQEGWSFLEESYRILKYGGVIRITAPCISKIKKLYEDELHGINNGFSDNFLKFSLAKKWSDGTFKSVIRALVYNWGHQSLWTPELLITVLNAIGFNSYEVELHKSNFKDLIGVEKHWRDTSMCYNDMESFSVEGVKKPLCFRIDRVHI